MASNDKQVHSIVPPHYIGTDWDNRAVLTMPPRIWHALAAENARFGAVGNVRNVITANGMVERRVYTRIPLNESITLNCCKFFAGSGFYGQYLNNT